MSFFISDAMAATSDAGMAAPGGGLSALILPLIFLLIFYFMLWRPQSKRSKEQREMIDSIQKGDEVVINGGILGKIHDMSESYFTVTIAEGINVTVQRNAIHAVLPKGSITTF